ncbi:unnamed protein product [Meganyctiphanes norvegica]|uniref:Uncharacterized protein n=1 Tax=Meganyctiphanes norvegica TaxID=48144 RepID=A0AAV2PUD5_MEGNR
MAESESPKSTTPLPMSRSQASLRHDNIIHKDMGKNMAKEEGVPLKQDMIALKDHDHTSRGEGGGIDFFWNFNMLPSSNYVVICTNHKYDIVFEKKVCLTP